MARKFAFDWRDEVLLQVAPGELFEVETFDASNGYIRSEHDKAIPARRPVLIESRHWPTRSPGRSGSKAPSAATFWLS